MVPQPQNVDQPDVQLPKQPIEPINLERLYKEHGNHVFRFVQRYVRNAADAEDIMQATFLEAMRCADRFEGLSKQSTWLFGIAMNVARNYLRKSRPDQGGAESDEWIESIADFTCDPANLAEYRELVMLTNNMLEGMPTALRDTFESVLDSENTYDEAAKNLGVPIGTVRSRVSRVRSQLKSITDDAPISKWRGF